MAENFDITTNENEEEFVVDFGEVTRLGGGGGTSDFNDLTNRPQYNNEPMTGNTNIPKVPSKTSDLENDSNYQTGSDVEGAISSAIANKQDVLTAGDNITIEDNTISATDTTYTAGTNISISSGNVISATDTTYTAGANVSISDENVISATNTTYSNFTGTDGQTAGTAGLVPAPATTDVDKFLKSDGTWATSGGGGDTVYSTVTTSNASDGGAVYIGPLNASQQEQPDPTTTDNHYRYFWALPFDAGGQDIGTPRSETINIGGKQISGTGNVTLGYRTSATGDNNTVLGRQAKAHGYASNVVIGDSAQSSAGSAVALGRSANTAINGTIALGAYSQPTRGGEVNVGTSQSAYGYNSTKYRVIGGVHDGQDAHDAATVSQVNATIDAINTALNTSIPHIGAA